ncbi:transcriptional factor B3 family protein [Striga asiatica]|uniref:Transcriptional factor B3 family protein n=1 Tax=Striga asiatica TaxID=4170 RepID=A0A5A7PTU7_STRAF|nr:transcriptional factor B3 family protein [Striga asiatica]
MIFVNGKNISTVSWKGSQARSPSVMGRFPVTSLPCVIGRLLYVHRRFAIGPSRELDCWILCILNTMGRMDNMDVDGQGPHFFKAVHFRTLHHMVFRPATQHHYRGVVLPQTCTIQTAEGRTYHTTLKMVNNCPTLMDGWRDFILTEDITLGYFLVFRPRTIFDYEVTVLEPNGRERLPHHTFHLEIKPTHLEGAPIPMSCWRDYVQGQYPNYRSAILHVGDNRYEVDVIQGHRKKLIQNGRARQFIDDNNIVVACTSRMCAPGVDVANLFWG